MPKPRPFTAQDAVFNNQPIAKEGVLTYEDGGSLKRWEDLEMNIGRVVPVLDEHPSMDNGNFGMYSGKEHIWGYAHVKQLGSGHRLGATMMLYDGAPVKKGYSVGFSFIPIQESGVFDGAAYDEIQAFLVIDHVALTTAPRDPTALQMAPDAAKKIYGDSREWTAIKGATGDNGAYLNAVVAYDSMVLVEPREQEIRDTILSENPDISEDELVSRVAVMLANEKELQANNDEDPTNEPNDEETDMADKDTGNDSAKLLVEKDAEIERLKREIQSDAEKQKVIAERDAKDAEIKKLRAEMDAIRAQAVKTEIDSLVATMVRTHQIDATTFDGQTLDYIRGASKMCEMLSPGPETGVPATEADANKRNGTQTASPKRGYPSGMYRPKGQDSDRRPILLDPEGNPVGHIYPADHIRPGVDDIQ